MAQLQACSDIARKTRQPGLFCFMHAKNAADRKDPIYFVLRNNLHRSALCSREIMHSDWIKKSCDQQHPIRVPYFRVARALQLQNFDYDIGIDFDCFQLGQKVVKPEEDEGR